MQPPRVATSGMAGGQTTGYLLAGGSQDGGSRLETSLVAAGRGNSPHCGLRLRNYSAPRSGNATSPSNEEPTVRDRHGGNA